MEDGGRQYVGQSVQRDDCPADVSRLGRICTGSARQNCIISVAASTPVGRRRGEWHHHDSDGEKAKARTQDSGGPRRGSKKSLSE